MRNPFRKGKKSKFVIFFQERSGSTFLTDILNQHSQIYCGKEVFYLDWEKQATGPYERRIYSKRESLKALDQVFSKKKLAVGFKYKYPTQFKHYPEIWSKLVEDKDEVKIIFLYRINRLKAAISKQNLEKLLLNTKESNLKKENNYSLDKLELNIPKAVKYIKWREHLDAKFMNQSKMFKQRLFVNYEDLLKDQELVLKNIFDFLNVKNETNLQSNFKKVTKDNLENAITNLSELKEKLTCSPLEKYLY